MANHLLVNQFVIEEKDNSFGSQFQKLFEVIFSEDSVKIRMKTGITSNVDRFIDGNLGKMFVKTRHCIILIIGDGKNFIYECEHYP